MIDTRQCHIDTNVAQDCANGWCVNGKGRWFQCLIPVCPHDLKRGPEYMPDLIAEHINDPGAPVPDYSHLEPLI